jgi:peroxiredoxin Q/BCP
MLQVGDTLPTFSLQDDRGESVDDAALRSGAVVLCFYPKDDTPGCTRQACELRDDLSVFETAGVRIFGVSADDVASHAAFREKFALTFPLLADPDHTLCEAVGVWGEQEWNGHRYQGIARTTFVLRDGVVTHVFENVDVTGHSARVLAAAKGE